MRLTGSMVMRFMERSLTEFHLESSVGFLALQQVVDHVENCLRGRRTAGQTEINLDEFAQRPRLLQQSGDAIRRDYFSFLRTIDIYALQQFLHRNGIPHRRDVPCDSAVSEGDQHMGSLTDLLNLIEIVLGTDCALDKRNVHVFGKLLRIDQGAIDQVDLAGQRNDASVHVEQRHVAAGASVEPDRGYFHLLHTCTPLRCTREVTASIFFTISPTAQPFSESAPVGHAFTHLPQLVQVVACPQFSFISLTMRAWMPREVRSQTCAPSSSAQTRTQRVQRMQRLCSSTKRGCDMSMDNLGKLYARPTVLTPRAVAID